MIKLFGIIILAIFIFSGCSLKPDKLYLYPEIKDNSAGEIVFIRSNHLIGSIVLVYFAVDGKNLTALMGNEYTKIKIPVGEHTTSIEVSGGWSLGYKRSEPIKFNIQSKEIKYEFVKPNAVFSSFPYTLQIFDENRGKHLINGAKYREE
jgi:hypothetical protein